MGSRLRSRDIRRQGIAIILTALMLVFLIPVVGLAIDAGVLYTIKSKLQMSVDAGAIAAARTLNKGLTLAEQEGNARAKAAAFFEANFPAGTFGTVGREVTTSVAESGFRRRTVTVSGTVQAPTYFMRVFGYKFTPVSANGTAARRDVNIIMVMDRSGSMQSSNSCTPMKTAAKNFVSLFANHRDRLGIVLFGGTSFVSYPPRMNFMDSPTISASIDTISCTGSTSSAQALWQGYQQIVNINEPGVLNILLFFTDGLPNGITAAFPIKKLQDTRYGYGVNSTSSAPPNGNASNLEQFNSTSTQYTMWPSPCVHVNTAVHPTYQQTWQRNHLGQTFLPSSPNPAWNPPDVVGQISQGASFAATGNTGGLRQPYAISATSYNESAIVTSGTTGCRFRSSANYMRRDIAFIPEYDLFGNATRAYVPVETFTASGHPYQGRIRPDKPSSIGSAGKNAAYNAALRARQDTRLQPVVYSIGLGNPNDPNPNEQPDLDFLRRVSNDQTSPEFDENMPEGLFVYAPDNTQLNSAFVRIASEILRIAN